MAIIMLDDFFVRAVLAGCGLAIVAGPLGCFVIWRRMAFFGETLAHAGLIGVALSLATELPLSAGLFLVAGSIAVVLFALERRSDISTDSLLGILSHGSLAIGLILVSMLPLAGVDLMGLLIGDILSVNRADLAIIAVTGTAILALLALIWKPLLLESLSAEIAAAEAPPPVPVRLVYTLLIAALVAIAIKIVGILLLGAMLIIPAAAARRLAATPETMALGAAAVGIASVIAGLSASLRFDTPSGPAIVVAALGIFFLLTVFAAARRKN